ncbi:GNAT family N-acetyltransferase [Priestia endophytica]|uniref:GNAT family N-acetyltransferase n=1 Tax=Priestia endophytica TaxID=135735 RepID=UPI002E20D825|nr:GNAT family N-acetyltransferase [Priestia endophytica]
MEKLSFRSYTDEDFPFFQQLVLASKEWESEECSAENLPAYLKKYEMLQGHWTIYEQAGEKVGLSYSLPWAPSNEKPWLGTLLVKESRRGQGIGKEIITRIAEHFQGNHKAFFCACPVERAGWLQFLASSGFEQFKVEKSEEEKEYVILVYPL